MAAPSLNPGAGWPGFGVQAEYVDAWGHPQQANPDAVRLLRAALGEHADPPDAAPRGAGGARTRTCYLPPGKQSWGWAVQLYALRSERSWGIGDLDDLRRLGAWSARSGAEFIQLNPLHASAPVGPQQSSPYFPSSRRFRNPLYIAVEAVPGYAGVAQRLAPLVGRGRRLNSDRLIDRGAVLALKLEALETIWKSGPARTGMNRWAAAAGPALATYGTYCALAERHGADWRAWPAELRQPGSAATSPEAREVHDRAQFHIWLQWLLDSQLRRATTAVRPICDLAIGADPGGADAWIWSDELIPGFTVGAPPDELNLQGQNWGFPAFNPQALVDAGFGPFRETVRANMAHAMGVRIDHVMGLFRLWMIPDGASALDGAYVTYPSAPMLDILAEESRTARALVVGEDLGTVQPEVRAELQRRKILSYRLLWFEEAPPSTYPRLALSAVTTHDLPTVAGVWTGADARAMQEVGLHPNLAANQAIVERMARFSGVPRQAPAEAAVLGAYRALRRSPSRLLAATLDDALVVGERPNIPGTVDEWPNWSLALPGGLEGLRRSRTARLLAELMAQP
ncbi:MAG: 4-alpha-glucanotransferase [Candidatus Dormibacteria bacterium]